jgi:hypothetical protein
LSNLSILVHSSPMLTLDDPIGVASTPLACWGSAPKEKIDKWKN